jgi:predicted unusual protein kinase regulating ubiquinone biosynthesis (AarF/ABC1/UbiB family)
VTDETIPAAHAIDPRRYRRVRRFFARVALHILVWDVVFALPILRWLRPSPLARWRRLAGRYRTLAVTMGGVLIKLGQYLSTRVDILPLEVTRELAGLQDEVPEEPFSAIAASIVEDLGRPLTELFLEIEPEPLGAASLAQAHAARLHSGEEVVIKVLRPGIENLVETDLRAISVALRWLKFWRFVRRRVDLDWLMEEFSNTTRAELNLLQEGANAERFADNFKDDPGVYVPKIYWQTSGRRTLTEENVAFIKVNDLEALAVAGVSPAAVAGQLYRAYMEQIFIHNFVHADPHPGNLFVRPLQEKGEDGDRPFQVVFVDFGMAAVIPERLRAAAKDFIVGLGARDPSQVVAALRRAGILLPGADLDQLEEAAERVFDRFWGTRIGELNQLARAEAASLLKEFGRLLLETPVQAQADLLFAGRAIELLAGLALTLDPDFDPWSETIPFAQRLAIRGVRSDWREQAAEWALKGRELARLPLQLAEIVSRAERGRLTLRASLAPDSRRRLQRLENGLRRLQTTTAASALLVAGAVLMTGFQPWWLGLPLLTLGAFGLLYSLFRRL